MKGVYENILDMVGKTPLVEIRRLNPGGNVRIFAKLECHNPGGSIKDRTALFMIEAAEKRGELTKDRTILEATSGNTGIGLALVSAVKGYRLILAMSEGVSEERKKILKAMGAELHFTPAALGTDGAIEYAYTLYREHPGTYFIPDQFNNEDNINAHYHGTAEEIWRQTEGRVTMVVATLGTSGTAMGCARRLKEYGKDIRVVGVEPYLRHRIQGLKNMKESYQPGIFDRSRLDEIVNIHDEDAFAMARRLAREEGILAGMSSGAAMHVALEKAREMEDGLIVVIFPDSGERYLSTELFADQGETTLKIFNTLTRKKDFFRPLRPDRVLIHACGPTVHDTPHLGTYRRFVVADLVARYLELKGFHVSVASNIIDLADRSIRRADRENADLKELTERYVGRFREDLKKLNMRTETKYPRASEHVDAMVRLAEKLVEKGFAYEKLRSVYFDISKLDDYGVLSNIDLKNMLRKSTVEGDDYEKDSPVDFTLLKRSNLAELKRGIYHKTRWGNVRPGWHLECAAMALEHLGERFDIHASGTDILFPHCENVLAIGKAATGGPLANYWINTELVMLDGKKMSRSLENACTLEELEAKGYEGRDIRYFLLGSHYRKPLNFSFGALDTARNTVRRLNGFLQRLLRARPGAGCPDVDQYVYDLHHGFEDAMDDDFNISSALAALFEFVRKVNGPLSKDLLNDRERDAVFKELRTVDSVIAVMDFEPKRLPEEAEKLLKKREEARAAGRWSESDRIREALEGLGVHVQDTPEGTLWTMGS
ncbi:MAG TPA: cysteine--tRNA ligase [Syntrophales bacterium]|nr:cysteine--tRNA ligase [Syntrophales bacterium]